jgi:hypothetical protein
MKPPEKRFEKAERLMERAWKENKASPGENWQMNLMREIRSISGAGVPEEKPGIFNGFAWRFSLAAGAVTLVLLAYSVYSGVFAEMELSLAFFNDPSGFILSPPFG